MLNTCLIRIMNIIYVKLVQNTQKEERNVCKICVHTNPNLEMLKVSQKIIWTILNFSLKL
jgi:hypothetical protein